MDARFGPQPASPVTMRRIATLLITFAAASADAQVRVNPTGVSVSAMNATTVLLTYGGLQNQRPVEAFWCGELIPAAPARGLKCDPTTLYGRLPLRYDLSRLNGGVFTDLMSIPPSVARRAYQDAVDGATSTFFYVRRFVSSSGVPDEYVAVTCRLTGGGARSPFSLTDVRIAFENHDDNVLFVARGSTPPPMAARIIYTGTGRLVGRWEVVLPGDETPDVEDLLTEASLVPGRRGVQRRYMQLERFNVFLAPEGRAILPGPDPRRLPSSVEGTYRILLRIEATDDRETDSDLAAVGAGSGILHNGAVAGFPMPPLLYVVAGEDARTPAPEARSVRLLTPRDNDVVVRDSSVRVMWTAGDVPAFLYRIDFETESGVALWSAVLPRTTRVYEAPVPLLAGSADGAIRWRVSAVGADGSMQQRSVWRTMKLGATLDGKRDNAGSRPPPK